MAWRMWRAIYKNATQYHIVLHDAFTYKIYVQADPKIAFLQIRKKSNKLSQPPNQ